MGNCHFKTDFDAENITGKSSWHSRRLFFAIMNALTQSSQVQTQVWPPALAQRLSRPRRQPARAKIFKFINSYSRQQVLVPVPLLHRQRRLRQGVEGRAQEVQVRLRHERNEQGAHPDQAQCQVGHERAPDPHAAAQSVLGQHVLRVLGPRQPVPGHGPAQRRRPALPHLPLPQVRRRNHA